MVPPVLRRMLPPVFAPAFTPLFATILIAFLAAPAAFAAQPAASLKALYPAAMASSMNIPGSIPGNVPGGVFGSAGEALLLGSQPDIPEALGEHFAELDPETQGDLLMIRHQYTAAIDAYHRAPRSSAAVWNKLGVAYQHMYALDVARLDYEKALSLNPVFADALNNLGTVYYGQKSYGKAEKYYRRALHLKPGTACFYSNLGTAYFADHKYRQGLAAYQQAFAIDPQIFVREAISRIDESGPPREEAQLNYALARLYAQAGDLTAAMRCLRQAFSHGFDDRKRLMADKEFTALRETSEFHLLLAEEHWQD